MLHSLFCVGFWSIIFSLISYQIVSSFHVGINHVQKLHQVPCSKCAYFTGDYRLKCPVNPMTALSEDAINCRDFQATCNCSFDNWQNSKHKALRKS